MVGTGESSAAETAVRIHTGQLALGPSGVASQSAWRTRSAMAPRPAGQVAAFGAAGISTRMAVPGGMRVDERSPATMECNDIQALSRFESWLVCPLPYAGP